MSKILQITDLGMSFGSNTVFSNVTFEVDSDEILGIIGPNGAGKTVLLDLITGMLTPTSGSIVYDGSDISKWSIVKRTKAGIGRTFQVPKPFEQMTAYENVAMGGVCGPGLSEREASWNATEILEMIGLQDKMTTMAGMLGLLERKRLEIGTALALRPKLLLLDEVAGGLTETEVDGVLELVRTINSRGIGVIWIEHVLETMINGTDRVMCLAEGRVIISGKPMEVFNSPKVKEVYLGVDEE